jgi:hypothetical protein
MEPYIPSVVMQISIVIMKNSREIPQKLKLELSCDLPIFLLGVLKEKINYLEQTSVPPCSLQHYS